jgi:general stress protein YciG
VPLKRSKPALAQCKATTSSGERCKAKPHKDNLCFFHSDPKKAAELGRKGGKANRHTFGAPSQDVAPPESVGDVKRMLAQTMANVLAGKIDPKLGTTVAYMGIALLRAYEADPPPQINGPPSIYRALQFRTTVADVRQHEELPDAATDAIPAQTEKTEVSPRKQEEGYEIFDLP